MIDILIGILLGMFIGSFVSLVTIAIVIDCHMRKEEMNTNK